MKGMTVKEYKQIEAGGITQLDYFLSILRNENAPKEDRM